MTQEKKAKRVAAASINWDIPSDMIARFASNLTIQTIEDVFKISFFEIKPPLFPGSPELPPKEVRAECVASIIVTPNRLSRFIDALRKHLDQHNSKKKT